tara:strand:+ start:248 stop:718 length:471 start_codon:yes stop_codon:yes gene_type:complete
MEQAEVYDKIEKHFREKNDGIVKKIARHTGNIYNAEDVVQETYYRTCKYWHTFTDGMVFNTWFGTILNNAIKDYFKKEMSHGMSEDLPPDHHAPIRILQRIELSELLADIDEQDERVSRILRLYLLDGYTSKEVAEIVPESAANIRKIVQRFRDGL